MGHEADLLRMLEPAVRPGGTPCGSKPPAGPIEGRDFESLLAEAAAGPLAEPDDEHTRPVAKSPDPLQGLSGVDRIENAALRTLIAPNRPIGA